MIVLEASDRRSAGLFQRLLLLVAGSMCLLLPLASIAQTSTAGESDIRRGVIEQISDAQIASHHHTGIGAIVGAGLGLGVGSLIGGGHGRDVAQVLGTLGGAAAGHTVQEKRDQPVSGQQIIVRLQNGVLVAITQPGGGNLRVGQKVYVEGNGNDARVVPQ